MGVSNYTSTVTAAYVSVHNGTNAIALQSVSVAPEITTNGVNGLDTGTLAASTWYYVYVIYNGTTTAGLFSLSSTSPTLPSGYTYSARVGAVRTDSSGSKYLLQTLQYGKRVQYAVLTGSNTATLPLIASGVVGTPSIGNYVPYSVSTIVPPIASDILFSANANAGQYSLIVAPNGSYGAANSSTNAPPVVITINNNNFCSQVGSFLLESTNIYYAGSDPSARLYGMGFEINL
jgi:hypothetical protein